MKKTQIVKYNLFEIVGYLLAILLIFYACLQTFSVAFAQTDGNYCENRYGTDDLNTCYRILYSQGILFVDPLGAYGGGAVEGSLQCIGKALPTINDQAGFAAAINEYIDEYVGPGRTSPFQGQGQAFVDGGVRTGINPMLAVAHLKQENGLMAGGLGDGWAGNVYATEAGALNQDQSQRTDSFNAFGREAGSSQPRVYYLNDAGRIRTPYKWASWADSLDGEDGWFELIKRRYSDLPADDLTAHIMRYAPPSDGNNVEEYVNTIKDTMTGIIALAGTSISCGGTAGNYIWPISSGDFERISTCWNTPRLLNGRFYRHGGLDISAARGAPIVASASGEITYRGLQGGSGNLIIIKHPDGLYTFYKHQERFAEGTAVGSQVVAGQTIGYVNSTGISTGDHLHFDIGTSPTVSNANEGPNRTKNPLDYLPENGRETIVSNREGGTASGFNTSSASGTCVKSSVNTDGYINATGTQNINVR